MKEISHERKLQLLVFIEMLLLSMLVNSLAPLMTTFQEQYQLSMAQSSIFPVITTVAGIMANMIGTFLIAHIGIRRYNFCFLIIALLTSLTFYLMNSVYILYVALFFLGMSTATGMAVTSTILSHLHTKYQNFGLYHAFFGIGGIVAPILIGLALAKNIDYHNIYLLFLGISFIVIIYLWKVKLLTNYTYEKIGFIESLSVIKLRVVYLSLIIMVLYVGCEMGILLWSGNLFIKAFNFSKETSILFLSGFWMLFTLGRIFTHQIEKLLGFFRMQFIFISMLLIALVNTLRNSLCGQS